MAMTFPRMRRKTDAIVRRMCKLQEAIRLLEEEAPDEEVSLGLSNGLQFLYDATAKIAHVEEHCEKWS